MRARRCLCSCAARALSAPRVRTAAGVPQPAVLHTPLTVSAPPTARMPMCSPHHIITTLTPWHTQARTPHCRPTRTRLSRQPVSALSGPTPPPPRAAPRCTPSPALMYAVRDPAVHNHPFTQNTYPRPPPPPRYPVPCERPAISSAVTSCSAQKACTGVARPQSGVAIEGVRQSSYANEGEAG